MKSYSLRKRIIPKNKEVIKPNNNKEYMKIYYQINKDKIKKRIKKNYIKRRSKIDELDLIKEIDIDVIDDDVKNELVNDYLSVLF